MNGTVDGTVSPPAMPDLPRLHAKPQRNHVPNHPQLARGCPHANTRAWHRRLPRPMQRKHHPFSSNARVGLLVDVARPHVRQSRQARQVLGRGRPPQQSPLSTGGRFCLQVDAVTPRAGCESRACLKIKQATFESKAVWCRPHPCAHPMQTAPSSSTCAFMFTCRAFKVIWLSRMSGCGKLPWHGDAGPVTSLPHPPPRRRHSSLQLFSFSPSLFRHGW